MIESITVPVCFTPITQSCITARLVHKFALWQTLPDVASVCDFGPAYRSGESVGPWLEEYPSNMPLESRARSGGLDPIVDSVESIARSCDSSIGPRL